MQYFKRIHRYTFLIFGILLFTACKDEFAEMVEEQKKLDDNFIQAYLTEHNITNATRTASGVYYIPGTAGTGAQIQKSNLVTAHYIGRYLNGQKFESTYDSAQPATFRVGVNQMAVRGLDEGLMLLKNGERATLIIPSGLAYGRAGGNAVLVYELEIKDVK